MQVSIIAKPPGCLLIERQSWPISPEVEQGPARNRSHWQRQNICLETDLTKCQTILVSFLVVKLSGNFNDLCPDLFVSRIRLETCFHRDAGRIQRTVYTVNACQRVSEIHSIRVRIDRNVELFYRLCPFPALDTETDSLAVCLTD